ncbi:hypothetical protein QQ008_22665 [Fulvivirgaceae bacterium BMA10]|uniref:Uncharacterized protein n=1 Tax=Splendidivirga corallicola TaxID=3051826 RepID=A0ABT8KX73_9BACT|nr:hypothetical protein [Fulvivirgaceae bacterium BMA10]
MDEIKIDNDLLTIGFGYRLFYLENSNRHVKLREVRKHDMNSRKHSDILAIHKDKEK